MNAWIERYVYDVTRRLPEKDREEVSRELTSNICDMLPEEADDDAVEAVLRQLGPPAALAGSYRQKQRYLISPAVYDDYIRTLKWILPLVGVIVLIVGAVLGAIEAIEGGQAQLGAFIGGALGRGLSMGISAALQALLWTTVGFVIYERVRPNAGESLYGEWKLEDLPTTQTHDKARIPRSDSIAELVIAVVFGVAILLFCTGAFPIAFSLRVEGQVVQGLFSETFLAACIPIVTALVLLTVAECVVKIVVRRWTPLVCGVTVLDNVISVPLLIYLIHRPDMLSDDFAHFLQTAPWGDAGLLRFMGEGVSHPLLLILTIVFIAIGVGTCASALYKTIKYRP